MLRCTFKGCLWKASSIDGYIHHLSRMHETINGFSCIYENCVHKCSTLKSLRHHLNKYHNSTEPVTITQIDVNEPCCTSTDTPNTISLHDALSNNNSSDGTDNIMLEERKVPDIFDADQLREEIKRMRMMFILNWLSKDSIARKVVFDIQKDINTLIIDPIKKMVELMFNAAMLPELCKNLLDELLSAFDAISEYKFIQQLKSQSLYQDPSFFIISEELKPAVVDHTQQMVCYF